MSAEEMTLYYTSLHQRVLERDGDDHLSAVIGPSASPWVNRFTDFAHRLGMKKAFRVVEANWGSLTNRTVLDLGCGRGRWSKEYAARGALVTGVDISPEAIRILADELPQHCFITRDVTKVTLPDARFDLVNSVTVLQHLPERKQRIALNQATRWLKPGGRLVLLENILAFDAPHVFPHPTDEWIKMAEATGLRCTHCWGSNFELLSRMAALVSGLLRGNRPSRGTDVPPTLLPDTPSRTRRMKSLAGAALAIASFAVEPVCHQLPLTRPTHSVMIFTNQSS
jgi:ubiquinone/menaquinone biosynthesis C-methylase UbiE